MSMKSDIELKRDVEAELRWDPRVNATHVGVSVDKGVVSLLGQVDNYAEKWAAAEATKRVAGVRALAQDLTVKLAASEQRSDADVAAAALHALRWDVWVPSDVSVQVQGGRVMLEGHVAWNYQRAAAERAVSNLAGVTGVINAIRLRAPAPGTPDAVSASQVVESVDAALKRQATTDAQSIHVEMSGGKVTLSGEAASFQAIADATHAAWAAAGVNEVVEHVNMVGR
jgi:osmotically-inducible protein OsmY